MGTDIHLAVEVRKNGRWEAVMWPNRWHGRWDDEPLLTANTHMNRDYDLFAILGNVRNGRGFAGVVTGDGFAYISDCRGLPDDISPEAKEVADTDHSHSWVSFKEILDFDWTQVTRHRGFVTLQEFERWDRLKEWDVWPDSWYGDTSGQKISNEEARQLLKDHKQNLDEFLKDSAWKVHTLITWEATYADSAKQLWITWMPRLLALKQDPENVRLVFSFDS